MKQNPNYVERIDEQPESDTSSHLFKNNHTPYKVATPQPARFFIDESFTAEPIEYEVERMQNNGEPIGAASPQIFTDRMDGVKPEYDIRADHFELALDATELAAKNQLTRRQEFHDKLKKDNQKGDSGTAGGPPTTP